LGTCSPLIYNEKTCSVDYTVGKKNKIVGRKERKEKHLQKNKMQNMIRKSEGSK